MKRIIFIDILLLIGAIYFFSMCSNNNVTHANYNINHYVDTINGHIILTTVCNETYQNNISVSTLDLK